jgi:ketopantoate hydroxymethyltransferase
MREAFEAYRDDVRAGDFPAEEHSFGMPDEVWAAIEEQVGG